MNARFDNNLKKRVGRAGSVLVMVVVLTVLLALIGVLFVVMARMDNMSASGAANNADLHAGVEAVVDKIKSVMVEDLFTAAPFQLNERVTIGEMQDSSLNDLWLASLEPERSSDNGTPLDESDDTYNWPYISDIYGYNFDAMWSYREDIADATSFVSRTQVKAKIILPNDVITPVTNGTGGVAKNGASADADGDGVSDSRWVVIPKMRSSKGKDIYAAVRIIDNCAMLNLNTAHTKDSSTEPKYLEDASYLSAVDYEKFLRGDDRNNTDNIRKARKPNALVETVKDHHDNVVMHIENPDAYIVPPDPNPVYSLFDIGDELEIRNRYMLTSFTISRFERKGDSTVVPVILPVAYETFDGDRGYEVTDPRNTNDVSGPAKVRRVPYKDITLWFKKINPDYFDNGPADITKNWSYDRRHVCTFYSFDRNLRRRDYPLVDVIGDITSPPPAAATPWTIDITKRDFILASMGELFIPRYGAASINDITKNLPESRKKILHLLYALRAYFIEHLPAGADDRETVQNAARQAAQYVANMIDYADYPGNEGPFFNAHTDYGDQKNVNPTYINRKIISRLILEASGNTIDIGVLPVGNPYDFGLGLDDVASGPVETVYGYERQPFISELYCENVGGFADDFRVELCNPYPNPLGQMSLEGWRISIGTDTHLLDALDIIDAADGAGGLGYLVITKPGWETDLLSGDTIKLQRPDPANTGQFITVDETEAKQTQTLLTGQNKTNDSQRDDTLWKFIDASQYRSETETLGLPNGATINNAKGFQLPVANKLALLSTLHGLEGVTVLGNGGPNGTITQQIGQMAQNDDEFDIRFNVENDKLLEYISLINRPNGRLPGRININTATMEVIRAAIPESAPVAWGIDADALATAIVTYRNTNPIATHVFTEISDLLKVPGFKDFVTAPNDIVDDVGDAAFTKDIEERDWILSRLANIFTVRSDTFTAYILVRLGVDGPQKRMIAILDRTNVSSPSDKPKLVALHPVPDPR